MRNSELIKKRDDALCRRYVFWSEVKRLRTDEVLRILSQDEFFISEERILNIIRTNGEVIKSLVIIKQAEHKSVSAR
ncbi:MAG: transposase [Prevotellaceae bacterium]|jgi:hypothetical protein|nr:transposase [Prevotellaceae bacterium]